tara:strand:- start:1645 stop:2280 length:636 start_codon:yes stop_codon:yes gene_type:complete
MKKVLYLAAVLLISCKKQEIKPYPCLDGTCETNFWIEGPSKGKTDLNGYTHIKWIGANYFSIRGKLAELHPKYIINGVPLIETTFDSDYWVLFDTIKFTTPMYSVLGWYSDKQFNTPISIGNYTYTLKNIAEIHPPLNIAGYQISNRTCFDCPYSSSLFGTYSKYNYAPKQNMFLSKYMKNDTANVYIEVLYNSDMGSSVTKKISFKIIFD